MKPPRIERIKRITLLVSFFITCLAEFLLVTDRRLSVATAANGPLAATIQLCVLSMRSMRGGFRTPDMAQWSPWHGVFILAAKKP
jgi:hypothetical protein